MNKEQLLQLINRAQKEPDFFHKLVFDPEKAVKDIKKIDSSTKQTLLKADPDALMRGMVSGKRNAASFSVAQEPSVTECVSSCANTCGSTTNAMRAFRAGALDSPLGGLAIMCDDTYTCCCTSGTCGSTCGGRTCDVTCSGDSCGSTCGDSCGYTTHLQSIY